MTIDNGIPAMYVKIPLLMPISYANIAEKYIDLECNANIKQVEEMDMNGHEVQEVHYYYKGICKSCLGNEYLTKITNN